MFISTFFVYLPWIIIESKCEYYWLLFVVMSMF